MHQTGDFGQAELLCRRALAADPAGADALHLLAVALFEQNRLDEASRAAERATSLRPNIPAYWLTRGNIEEDRCRESEAQSAFARAIALAGEFPEAHYGLARSYQREGKFKDAIAEYRAALQGATRLGNLPDIHYHFAMALAAHGDLQNALGEFQSAFALDPGCTLDRRECLRHIADLNFAALPEFWHGELTRFFRREDIDKNYYAAAGLRVLKLRPEFRALQLAAETHPGSGLCPEQSDVDQVTHNDLFGILLRDTVLADPEIELVLTRMRRTLLLDREFRARPALPFLCDLALQCFNNEFVYDEAAEELEALTQLATEIETGLQGPAAESVALLRTVAVLAMYRPLYAVAGMRLLPERGPFPAAFERLYRRTVNDTIEELKLRAAIPAVGSISDEISRRVRSQYEENPYPRWRSFDRLPPLAPSEWIRANVPGLPANLRLPDRPRILVAGCGTGSVAISIAAEIESAQVTAVDLSLASLAYARRRALELGVANVEFLQCDILELAKMGDCFDLISCEGVLHHMKEPRQGLRSLADRLRPGGFLKLGLYSEPARVGINAMRKIVDERQLKPVGESIRTVRRLVLASPQDPSMQGLLRTRDFYSMSECRDLLFHVQEHQFRLPALLAMLRGEGLAVLGMDTQTLRHALPAYRRLFPGDAHMTDPQRWEAVEARHPNTFESMYRIWCQQPARENA